MYESIDAIRSQFFKMLVFHATFSNISAISWRPVLVVEEAAVPEQIFRKRRNYKVQKIKRSLERVIYKTT